MAWIWAAVMPHPPIIIPDVGKGREQEASTTLKGVAKLLEQLAPICQNQTTSPDVLLVLSPHQPYVSNALYLNSAQELTGNLGAFGAFNSTLSIKTPAKALNSLANYLKLEGIDNFLAPTKDLSKDHGSFVPLYFIKECFTNKKLPSIIIANPIGLSYEQSYFLGQKLASFKSELKWALVASGDLSHRLTPNAPCGFNPNASLFDASIVRSLELNNPKSLLNLPNQLIEDAGECGLRSVLTFLGLTQKPATILSYECPFGVGYCTALTVL